MRVCESVPFAHELIGPLHQESYRRPGAAPAPGEVAIGPDCSILAYPEGPIVRAAADHLRGFLVALGQASFSQAGRIRLVVAPTIGGGDEAHAVRVSADEVEIAGAGPRGVLQGVFHIERLMRERGGPFLPVGEQVREPVLTHRIHRSALSPFYVEELTGFRGPPFDLGSWGLAVRYTAWTEEDAGPETYYHDNYLLRLLEHGVNAIWLRGALREFARVPVFPEYGGRSEDVLGALRRLCERAGRLGMRVFLYLNEPMGVPDGDPFWQRHPDVGGVLTPHAPIRTLCTTRPEVKDYLREGPRHVFAQVPELSGVILITASEYPSHCYCHQSRPEDPAEVERLVREGRICPRCAERTPQEVVAEVVTLIRDGVKAANPTAQVIAWNWSWSFYEPDPQTGILECLPRDVIVMGDFERGEPTRALGFDYENDEYSIKVVGPSRRYRGVAEFQRGRGMPIYAKIQIGTTHENPTVPYLPALSKVAEKYIALGEHGVSGIMSCWNFGNVLSMATEVGNEFAWSPLPATVEEGLRRVACRHFGPEAAPDVVAAWVRMSEALDDFPGSIPVLYNGPVSRAPAFCFEFEPIGREFPSSWLLDVDPRGDVLGAWTSPFGPERVAACYRAVADRWAEGLELMESALAKAEGNDRRRLERELGVARMCWIQLRSSANLVAFLLTRDALRSETDPESRRELIQKLHGICQDEREIASAALPLCDADSRLGWHGEGYGYMFNRELIEHKLTRLEETLRALEG